MKKTFQSALIFYLVIGQLHATAALPQENTPQIVQKSTTATPVLAYLNKKQTPASLAAPIISGITGALSTGITAFGCFVLYSPERTERLVRVISDTIDGRNINAHAYANRNLTQEQIEVSYYAHLTASYGSAQNYENLLDRANLSRIKYITITVGVISVALVGFTVYKTYQYFKAKKVKKTKTVKQQTV